MSTHIGAAAGQIAPHVLMPGDPLRARWIAETVLDDATCYTEVRGMYGYTGTWRGNPVSVQGSGMGMPSISIYLNELFGEYDVQSVVRVGSCGALTSELGLRDLVIASGACTDSAMNRTPFRRTRLRPRGGLPAAAQGARRGAGARGLEPGGLVLSGDSFYHPRPELVTRMAEYGVLAVEMEASALYTLAAQHRCRALADLHGLRPHPDRRADHRPGAPGDASGRWWRSPSSRAVQLTQAPRAPARPGRSSTTTTSASRT